MRKTLLLLGAAFWIFSLQAQQQGPVVLVSAKGKVVYTSPGSGKQQTVRVGAALKPEGKITLKKGGSAVLHCNGQFVAVNQPGSLKLTDVCLNGGSSMGLGFDIDFGEKVVAAVELAAFADRNSLGWVNGITKSKNSGDGWGTGTPQSQGSGGSGWGTGTPQSQGSGGSGWGTGTPQSQGSGGSGWGTGTPQSQGSGGSGWGTPGSKIQLILPFGKLVNGPTTFFWSNQGKHQNFQFSILDEANKKVWGTEVRDSFLQVNLNELPLQVGAKYHWNVSVSGNAKVLSTELSFELGTEEKRLATLNKLESMKVLQAAPNDVSLRYMAQAIALEKSEWYYSAYETYLKAKKNNPNNLTRMMHAAFYARYQYYPLAEKSTGAHW
ncbi:MAG: hypothetical protein JNJ57_04535 [Saprospiraceae bacterium]|nr:hypothetical protein [Saprospiraceae bacterium]